MLDFAWYPLTDLVQCVQAVEGVCGRIEGVSGVATCGGFVPVQMRPRRLFSLEFFDLFCRYCPMVSYSMEQLRALAFFTTLCPACKVWALVVPLCKVRTLVVP
jgi:hypothetical protein